MYWVRLTFVLTCLATCHCLIEKDEKEVDYCDLKLWLESTSLSVEISKQGFHREVTTTVELSPAVPSGVRVLLVYQWPRGVFIDPYQLASLKHQGGWQILLDSAIDLEVPAHKTSGFVSYVYPTPADSTPRRVKFTIPIHGRYHEPSAVGKTFTSVDIHAPELLLQNDKCLHLNSLEPNTVVDAPCTVDNSSTCSWFKIQYYQKHGPKKLQFPVGDGSMVIPVCGGTLLVTMICCVVLTKYICTHQTMY
ncbi:phosphatidylinositol-glycan biosynthesis class X protein isoform X1 [Solea solea]|uniref:phosphatidylinositol-glycan biosynthesis class X protein isoform X1 n=1 Tax=Solea solea TaxID=90069 RepID=UPI00272BD1C4|nr:phosphatidylinositol-glycan biosynthesis class X protein isoform X1 [Solea solea]